MSIVLSLPTMSFLVGESKMRPTVLPFSTGVTKMSEGEILRLLLITENPKSSTLKVPAEHPLPARAM